MAKNAMPVSKAKTAYGLLSEIRALILEEPKRYDQTVWKRDPAMLHRGDQPTCGTICCVAGWVDQLKSDEPVPSDNPYKYGSRGGFADYEIAWRAREVLGLSMEQRDELFGAERVGPKRSHNAHAKRGAAHIARFQKKYAKQLKAKRV